jgi:acetyl-CoA carboxylase carboxyltransferase component
MKSDEDELAVLRDRELQSSYHSATRLGVDEMIDPRETRNVLLQGLGLAMSRRQIPPEPGGRITP